MHLFIDTNIFLAFYHLTNDDLEELRKLVVLIEQEQVVLILTDQVVDEFRRNRETKIAEAIKGLKEQRLNLHFPQVCKDYPEYTELRSLQQQYERCHAVLLDKISKDVTQATLKADGTISELFAKSKRIGNTPERIARARYRVAVGNPPGKEGSLGDAINWEAVLELSPSMKELHFITDDRDFVSALEENRFKEFLISEWTMKAPSKSIRLYRRLSAFFKEHFPHITLASELEKEIAIQSLVASGSFSDTHLAIARLDKHTQFTTSQRNDIVRAAVTNRQITWIISDADVRTLLLSVITGHESELEDALLVDLQAHLSKGST